MRAKVIFSIITVMIFETIFLWVSPNGSTVMANVEASDNNVAKYDEAKTVASNFIQSTVISNEEMGWTSTTEIDEKKVIFNFDDEISSYLFYLKDIKSGQDNGYIVVSADKSNMPILEYSSSNDSFFKSTLEKTKGKVEKEKKSKVKKNHTKIYDLGFYNYAACYELENNNTYTYDITSTNSEEINIEDIADQELNIGNGNVNFNPDSNKEAWNQLKYGEYNLSGGDSYPPDSGSTIITVPQRYETGYSSPIYNTNVTNYKQNYWLMEEFHSGGVCGATAAVNLFYYWYKRNPIKYKKLCRSDWYNTFDQIYGIVGSNAFSITLKEAIYGWFVDGADIAADVKWHYGTNHGRDIVTEIKNDYPAILLMHDHYYYNDHYAVALGYQEFVYKDGNKTSYSTYILLADGHIKTPTRYVWGGCKGQWYYISVRPEGE